MTRFLSVLVLLGCLWSIGMGGVQLNVFAGSADRNPLEEPPTANSLLLDQYPDAYAGYSLRKLREDYSGPAIRVRRGSDGAVQDFGFDAEGNLDVAAIESWLSGSDGELVRWYSQVAGVPDIEAGGSGDPPLIAQGGAVFTRSDGLPQIYVHSGSQVGLRASGLSFPHDDFSLLIVGEVTGNASAGASLFHTRTPVYTDYKPAQDNSWVLNTEDSTGTFFRDENIGVPWGTALYTLSMGSGGIEPWYNDESIETFSKSPQGGTVERFDLFYRSTNQEGSTGYVSEVLIYPAVDADQYLYDRYDNMNSYWQVGPTGTNREAILPQREDWHVALYDWLEALDEGDVSIPEGTINWDGTYSDIDALADLWLQVEGLSASSVVRSEPGWYVLDNGNGKGIEATGNVKNVDEPKGSGDYVGNPPRSWSNEPAFLYQLDIPLSDGGQGNPWYQNSAMGRRALVVAIVDMMMHSVTPGFSNWTDMHGKALLGWAETYKWCKSELPSEVLRAYEEGMEHSLDMIIDKGARGVNTNMDMFAMKAAAEIYAATENSTLQDKALKAVRRTLLGNTNATQVGGPNHEVFATGEYDKGVFHPAGFIMEGDQPDIFYMGESMYHLAGALQAVRDRDTGDVASEWSFLEEVVQRMQEWLTYQMFYDPATAAPALPSGPAQFITAGAGFSGRTGAGVPSGQADEIWKHYSVAELVPNSAFVAAMDNIGPTGELPTSSEMESDIVERLSYIDGETENTYTESPADWKGWSPWTKHTPYLPTKGWFSDLQALANSDDPKIEKVPAARSGVTWNKTFGGPPTGESFWSYKGEDADGEAFGFFVEAMAHQGGYGGWYGGKIETFWTESTGVVLINRHGKTGCDDNFEDSVCWGNLDEKAAHHVWGRDENGNGFTTLLLRGRELSRTSTFDMGGSSPTVTVNNVFNDPSLSETTSRSGERTGSEIEGDFEVENKFEVQSNGLKVTHALTSDETDEVNELWASLPVYLRANNPIREGDNAQGHLEDTSIEYWDGSSWQALPEDADDDGVPEIVTTSALRLGRDYSDVLNEPIAYAYVSFTSSQDVRLSLGKYYDPYQTKTGVRTVHIDLHGNPGTVKTLPAEKSVSYTIQTTDPTTEGDTSGHQEIHLKEGGNIVSTFVSPTAPAMDSVFAGLQSEIAVVENEAGEQYRPSKDINEIGQWESEEAYLIQAKSEVTLSMHGEPLGTSSVALEQGWNWVPYFPPSPVPVEEAVSSIAEDLILLKDETGRAYSPDKGIDVLEQMEPGEGYKIYVNQSTTLNYPASSN